MIAGQRLSELERGRRRHVRAACRSVHRSSWVRVWAEALRYAVEPAGSATPSETEGIETIILERHLPTIDQCPV